MLVAAVLPLVVVPGARAAQEEPAPPPRDAFVAGKVVDDGGTPVAGVDVVVRRSPGIAEQIGSFATFVFTLGLSCVAGADPCDSDDSVAARTVSAGDGTFRLPLGPEYVPGSESDTDFFVTAARPAVEGELSGPATTEEFEVAQEVQTSPDLMLWTPTMKAEVTPEVAIVGWDPLDPDEFDDGTVSHAVRFLTAGGVPLATFEANGTRLDARMLEDATGAIALVAKGDITVGPTIYHQTFEAARVAFAGRAGAPPSRSKACAVRRTDGSAVATPTGCVLTDGDLEHAALAPVGEPCLDSTESDMQVHTIPPPPGFAALPEPPPCPPPLADATIDLGAPLDVGLIVVRGCDACSLATSTDGTAFTAFGGAGTARAASRPTTARYVRVAASPETGATLDGTAEVSVWQTNERVDERVEPDGTTGRPPAALPDGGRTSRGGPTALAVLLALVVGIAADRQRRLRAH